MWRLCTSRNIRALIFAITKMLQVTKTEKDTVHHETEGMDNNNWIGKKDNIVKRCTINKEGRQEIKIT